MELEKRKQIILIAIIQNYIETGEPVASKTLVSHLNNSVSSATIRNEMADLVTMGYLEQPHTSAGRIPSAKAFRLYIDRFMPKQSISRADKALIDDISKMFSSDPAQLISHASNVLAETTGLAAVSTTPKSHSSKLKHIEIIPASKKTYIVLILTDSGLLKSKTCRLDYHIDDTTVKKIIIVLSSAFMDMPLSLVTLAQVQNLLGSMQENTLLCAPIFIAFYQLINEAGASDVLLRGQLNILTHPDYDISTAKGLLSFLSAPSGIVSMLSFVPSELGVLIGEQSSLPELSGSSIVVTRYQLSNNTDGALGIVGPLRMDYSKVISHIEYISQIVSTLLDQMLYNDD